MIFLSCLFHSFVWRLEGWKLNKSQSVKVDAAIARLIYKGKLTTRKWRRGLFVGLTLI